MIFCLLSLISLTASIILLIRFLFGTRTKKLRFAVLFAFLCYLIFQVAFYFSHVELSAKVQKAKEEADPVESGTMNPRADCCGPN